MGGPCPGGPCPSGPEESSVQTFHGRVDPGCSFCPAEGDAGNWEQAQGKGTICRQGVESLWPDTVTWSQTLGFAACTLAVGRQSSLGTPSSHRGHARCLACHTAERAPSQAATSSGTPIHGTPPCRAAKALICLIPPALTLLLSMPFPVPRTSTRALTRGRGEPPALATSTPPPTAARACPPPSQGPPTISTAQVRISAATPSWAKFRPSSGEGITKLFPASPKGLQWSLLWQASRRPWGGGGFVGS